MAPRSPPMAGRASEDFRMLRGAGLARRYRSSAKGSRLFCPRCGSVVPAKIADKPVAIALGNITEDPVARPKAHFFVGSKAPWHDIVDDLPQFEEYPPAFGFDASKTGPPARTAPTPGATGGSCLCGAVAFEFTGTPLGMTNCHCRDCRRAMSAAFATTVAVERATLCRWLSGERDVVRYTSSRSPHATSAFCGICGSPVPRSGRLGTPGDSGRLLGRRSRHPPDRQSLCFGEGGLGRLGRWLTRVSIRFEINKL